MAGIFSLRNWVMKQLMKTDKSGIMKIPDKNKIDFGEMLVRESLFKKGIHPSMIKNEKQLDNILDTPVVPKSERAKPKKSGEVIEVDFDKGRWNKAGGGLAKKLIQEIIRKYKGRIDDKLLNQMLADDNPQRLAEVMATIDEALIMQQKGMKPDQIVETVKESFKRKKQAQGGRTGLSYLLAEDTNERIPLKDGHSPGRRKFLKIMGGLAALPVVGKLFKFAKPTAKVADLTSVPIKSGVDGMPTWFKPLVNKVIREGEQIKVTEYDRLITHKTKLPESKTDVYVHQDLNTGDVWVDIGSGKHGWADGYHGQPVKLEYKASEIIEPTINTKTGEVYHKGGKAKEEFWVEEAEFTGGHPENIKFEDVTYEKFGNHGSNFDEVEAFATGKLKKSKPTKKAEKLEYDIGKAEADAEAAADMADDFASGGIARMLGE